MYLNTEVPCSSKYTYDTTANIFLMNYLTNPGMKMATITRDLCWPTVNIFISLFPS